MTMEIHVKLSKFKIKTATRVRSNGSHFYNDARYKAYRQFLSGLIAVHLNESYINSNLDESCHLIVRLSGISGKQDLDNILKALQDCLVKDLGIIKDDKSKYLEGVFVLVDKSIKSQELEFWLVWGCDLLSESISILKDINGTIKDNLIMSNE